jgi:acyl-coenzyme A synthetase/AMP-(fatty) acid ligase
MMLAEALAGLPAGKLLALTSARPWTAGDFLRSRREHGAFFRDCRIGLRLSDAGSGLETLIVADGYATSITLIPATLPTKHLAELLRHAECNLLISDSLDGLADIPSSVSIYRSLASIPTATSAQAPERLWNDTVWHLATSGTTGTPKLVAHTLAGLSRTARRGQPRGSELRWGLLYDYTRFAGIQVALQAVLSGSVLIAPRLDAPLREKLVILAEHGCTHLSATPTMWRTIVMTPGVKDLPLRQATLGGEIADDRILATLQATYP